LELVLPLLIFHQSEVTAMIQRKKDIRKETMSHSTYILEKSRLQQLRNFAVKGGEHSEVITLDTQLAALDASISKLLSPAPAPDDASERLAKVNERNRKANMTSIRKAEQAGSERKRKERERLLAAAKGAKNASASECVSTNPPAYHGLTSRIGLLMLHRNLPQGLSCLLSRMPTGRRPKTSMSASWRRSNSIWEIFYSLRSTRLARETLFVCYHREFLLRWTRFSGRPGRDYGINIVYSPVMYIVTGIYTTLVIIGAHMSLMHPTAMPMMPFTSVGSLAYQRTGSACINICQGGCTNFTGA
jgi:hypothetical protein